MQIPLLRNLAFKEMEVWCIMGVSGRSSVLSLFLFLMEETFLQRSNRRDKENMIK